MSFKLQAPTATSGFGYMGTGDLSLHALDSLSDTDPSLWVTLVYLSGRHWSISLADTGPSLWMTLVHLSSVTYDVLVHIYIACCLNHVRYVSFMMYGSFLATLQALLDFWNVACHYPCVHWHMRNCIIHVTLMILSPGEAYMRLSKLPEAEHWYMESLRSKTDHIPAHLTYGKLLALTVSTYFSNSSEIGYFFFHVYRG